MTTFSAMGMHRSRITIDPNGRARGFRSLSASVTVGLALLWFSSAAVAYVGGSYMAIPGAVGDLSDKNHSDWIAFEGHYWDTARFGASLDGMKNPLYFSGPVAPRKGASMLTLAIDKQSPALARLMAYCASKQKISQLVFDESSDRARAYAELGTRPNTIPEFFEYRLKDATLSDCTVVTGAPWQAFVVNFADIEWVNYQGTGEPIVLPVEPRDRPVAGAAVDPDATKSFVVTWFAAANYVSAGQCPRVNSKPAQDAYFTYMSPADAAAERAVLGEKGPSYNEKEQMAFRGPHKINACALPGIVPDPGHAEPQSDVARGFNLDGGNGGATAKSCAHKKYASEDGRTGIDNQLFTAQGCIPGFMGSKGFILQFANKQMHDGLLSIIFTIYGIKDRKNNDNLDVSIAYSIDPMAKSGDGNTILPDYSFRISEKPELAHYNTHLHAHMVDGVITTDPVDTLRMNLTMYGQPPLLELMEARMRLQIRPDGTLAGILGGYQNWKPMVRGTSGTEEYFGFQCPGYYNALKRAADGGRDPATGECSSISSAYDIEAVPAFVVPPRDKTAALHDPAADKPAR
jgi:type VI protein secretion system component Hcp